MKFIIQLCYTHFGDEMKLLFKNKTKYDKKTYNEYLEFHKNTFSSKYMFFTIIVGLLFFFCFAMQIKYHYYGTAICFLVIFCIFIFWRLFHPIYEVKKEFKSKKISQEQVFTFKFYEKYFTICHNMDYSKMKYHKLHKIYETNKFFYLYIDNERAFLVNKDGFIRGSSSDFSKFIQKRCLFKYKNSI